MTNKCNDTRCQCHEFGNDCGPVKDHEKILSLIETVNPDDIAAMELIDAHVCAFLNDKTYISHKRQSSYSDDMYGCMSVTVSKNEIIMFWSSYTRSRDILKKMRPLGWFPILIHNTNGYLFVLEKEGTTDEYNGDIEMEAKYFPTEELTELYAVIQAIAYERSQK